jgi:hypothetical protein
MKRTSFGKRVMVFPTPLVRPITDHQPDPVGSASANGQRGIRSRRIFVIKQVRRLTAANAAGKKIQRILIFDDHPDSLRLVFGRRANPDVDLAAPPHTSPSHVILGLALILALVLGMVWPLIAG